MRQSFEFHFAFAQQSVLTCRQNFSCLLQCVVLLLHQSDHPKGTEKSRDWKIFRKQIYKRQKEVSDI